MKFSNIFFNSSAFAKDNKTLELVDLAQKAGFFHQDSAGIFSTLSLGYILEQKIEKIIQEELTKVGFSQVRLSLLQDAKLWKDTNRYDSYGAELFKLKNRKDREFVLGATCEESITTLVKDYYNHSKMDVRLFQIGNKYRDEMRAKGGLIRGKEFLMSDAYCFHHDDEQLDKIYQDVKEAYVKIFNRLGLKFIISSSEVGEMGGNYSEEFRCLSSFGEDVGEDGQNYLEIGHIFNLGNKYSKAFDLYDNTRKNVNMACFGIGVSRVIMALLEQHRDEKGFFGDELFNTFDYVISVIDYEKNKDIADQVYFDLLSKGFSVLLDDRDMKAGKKFYDSELIAAHKRIIINNNSKENKEGELMNLKTGEKSIYTI
jgi:prolyl-tRNA synthetase